MSKKEDLKKLESFNVDDILSELRARESTTKMRGFAKAATPLATYDNKTLVEALKNAQKLIYGMDDRQDMFQVTDNNILKSADSVVSLIDVGSITDNGNGTSTVSTTPFSVANSLCSSERFASQPTSPFCSGFLVAKDIVCTAGHCVDQNGLARVRFVFGFRMINESEAKVLISNDDIFHGTGIIDRKLESDGPDWALVRLDRPVTAHPVVQIRRDGKVGDQDGVYVIGHPSGLPLKYAPGAHVRDNSSNSFFVANLDTYGGNSGSPVFNQEDDVVEGILVRGDTDFVFNGTCWNSNVCPTTGCRGEDITRTTEFANLIPKEVEPTPTDIESRVANLEMAIVEIRDQIKEIKDKL